MNSSYQTEINAIVQDCADKLLEATKRHLLGVISGGESGAVVPVAAPPLTTYGAGGAPAVKEKRPMSPKRRAAMKKMWEARRAKAAQARKEKERAAKKAAKSAKKA